MNLTAVQGAEVVSASVNYRNERLIMHSEVLVRLPAAAVRAVLTDFENLPQVHQGLKEVRILERPNTDQVRMRAISEVCILFICRDFTIIQEVRTLASGDIVAVIEPGQSDFREGQAHWRLAPENAHTRLIFNAELVPNFWFPPFLGHWLIKRKLRDEALKTALGIERVAAQQ